MPTKKRKSSREYGFQVKQRRSKKKPPPPPKEKFVVAVHYYCGMMLEAIDSVMHAHRLQDEAKRVNGGNSLPEGELLQTAGINARYGFLTACFAAEAGANALLKSLPNISDAL